MFKNKLLSFQQKRNKNIPDKKLLSITYKTKK